MLVKMRSAGFKMRSTGLGPRPEQGNDLPLAAARSRGVEWELAVAMDAAARAAAIQVDRYERLERIVHKSERDIVTEVDTLSEEIIISTIRDAFPHDAFLAEESGSTDKSAPQSNQTTPVTGPVDPETRRRWVIDPLDGTVNYANGIPIFCTSICLVIDGVPSVAALTDPSRDDRYAAIAGGGAYLNGQAIAMPIKEKMSDLVCFMALPYGFARREWRIRKRIRVSRVTGSSALGLAYVGNGRFDAFIQPRGLSVWDIAAAGLIAQEGGARVTDGTGGGWFPDGTGTRSRGIIAALPTHHATILELLK